MDRWLVCGFMCKLFVLRSQICVYFGATAVGILMLSLFLLLSLLARLALAVCCFEFRLIRAQHTSAGLHVFVLIAPRTFVSHKASAFASPHIESSLAYLVCDADGRRQFWGKFMLDLFLFCFVNLCIMHTYTALAQIHILSTVQHKNHEFLDLTYLSNCPRSTTSIYLFTNSLLMTIF